MSNLLNAVDQIKAWAKKQEAVVNLAKELEAIGSLEQAAAESSKKVTEYNAQVEAAKSELFRVNSLVDGAMSKIDAAEHEAARIVGTARIEAGNVVSKAVAEGQRVVNEASDKAAILRGDVSAEVSKARAEVVTLRAEAESAKADTKAARAELESFKVQLADAKARAKEVFQGIA